MRFRDLPRALNDAGEILTGAELAFSVASAPQAVYADSDLSVPLSNPLQADGAGRFTPFWLDESLEYSARLIDAEDNEIWDEPVGPFLGTEPVIPLDDSGSVMPFATLTFWRSQTTQLVDVFEDAGLSVPADNPATADISGEFSALFVEDGEYRVKLERADGVLIFDVDPYQFYADPAPDFLTALSSSSVNGSDFTKFSEWAFGTGAFTVEAWYQRNGSVDNEQFRVLRARSAGGAQSGWEFQVRFVSTDTLSLRLLLRPASTSFTFTSSSFAMPNDVWFHAAIVVDQPNNLATFYVNGASIGTADISTGVGNVGIAGAASIMQSISGSVDELRVWSEARTSQQILDNYQLPYENLSSTVNLIADFQFNEGSGSTTTDVVNETVATLVSGAAFVTGPTL